MSDIWRCTLGLPHSLSNDGNLFEHQSAYEHVGYLRTLGTPSLTFDPERLGCHKCHGPIASRCFPRIWHSILLHRHNLSLCLSYRTLPLERLDESAGKKLDPPPSLFSFLVTYREPHIWVCCFSFLRNQMALAQIRLAKVMLASRRGINVEQNVIAYRKNDRPWFLHIDYQKR